MSFVPTIGESECLCRKLKNLMEVKKQTAAAYKKPDLQGKMDAVVLHTSWYVPERSISFYSEGDLKF